MRGSTGLGGSRNSHRIGGAEAGRRVTHEFIQNLKTNLVSVLLHI